MQKCIFAQRCVAKMHFCIKCILASNAFLHQMHFCTAEHFPWENVMRCKNAFLHQMHFCTAEHFPLENVMRCKNAFLHQMDFCTAKMHFCIKCIFAPTKCKGSIKCIFAKQNVTNAFDAALTFCWC